MAQFPVSGSQMRTFRCAMASYRWANPWVCKAAPGLTGSGRARQGWEFTGVIFLPPMVSTTVYKSHFDTVYLQIVDLCVSIRRLVRMVLSAVVTPVEPDPRRQNHFAMGSLAVCLEWFGQQTRAGRP